LSAHERLPAASPETMTEPSHSTIAYSISQLF
jgi:hypothetical protein